MKVGDQTVKNANHTSDARVQCGCGVRPVQDSRGQRHSARGRASRTAKGVRYGLLTPRHLLRPPRLHGESRGQTLLLRPKELLQANHLEEGGGKRRQVARWIAARTKVGWRGAVEESRGER